MRCVTEMSCRLPTCCLGSKLAAVRIAQPAEFGLCSLNERIFPTARAAFGVRSPSYGGSAADIRA